MRSFVRSVSLGLLPALVVACAIDSQPDPGNSSQEPIVSNGPPVATVPTAVPPIYLGLPWTPPADVARRLRILSGLPALTQTMLTQASATFLGKGPTMSFGLVLDDGLFYDQGFSASALASASANDPTADTVFRMGSLNKVFTAAGLKRVLELHPAVSINDLASKYVPDAAYVGFPAGEIHLFGTHPPITLANLVSHTSGLPNFGVNAQGVSIYPAGTTWEQPTEAQFLTMLHSATLLFDPGTSRSYSGVGMTIAGLAIEKITGTPYRNWMLSNFLAPLGMTHTVFDPTTEPAGSIAAHYSSAAPGSYTYEPPSQQWDIGALAPAGQLYTTVRDMAKFLGMEISSQAPASVPDTFLLKRADLVTTQTDLFPAATAKGGEPCGFGWFLNGSGEGYVHHNGGKDGYESNTYVSPQNRMAMTMLIGAGDTTDMDTMLGNAMDSANRADTLNDWHAQPLSMAVERLMSVVNNSYDGTTSSNFTPAFILGLYNPVIHVGTSLAALVGSWQAEAGFCRTFTVERLYSATHADLTLKCSKKDLAVSITASATAPYPIAGVIVE